MTNVAEWPKWLNDNVTKLNALGDTGIVSPTFVKELRDTCIELHHLHLERTRLKAERDAAADDMKERAAKLVDALVDEAPKDRRDGRASWWSALIACAANIRALT